MAVSVARDIRFALEFAAAAEKILPNYEPDGTLFHYTDAGALRSIVENRSLWASDVRYMNDTREIEHGLDLIRHAAERRPGDRSIKAIFDAALAHENFSKTSVFAVSLSKDGDLLSQWRAYGADGAGYAVGFDWKLLVDLPPKEWGSSGLMRLIRVEYRADEQERLANLLVDAVFTSLEPLKGHPVDPMLPVVSVGFANVFGLFAGMCKGQAFSEEAEWRLGYRFTPAGLADPAPMAMPKSSFRVGRYGLTPYLTIPFPKAAIRSIKRGPKLDHSNSEHVLRSLLAQNDIPNWSTLPLPHASASYR